jgi:hypothetical protein
MRNKLFFLFLLCSYFLNSQLLPNDRSTLWKPGLNSKGGIPTRTTIFKTLTPNGTDDTQQIQDAINTCPANQVIVLTEGDFIISGNGLDINKSNITLRGSGLKTRLIKNQGSGMSVINIGTRWVKFNNKVLLTQDAKKDAYYLIMPGHPNYSVGEIIALNQTTDTSITQWGSHAIEGDWSRCWFGDCDPKEDPTGRPVGQIMEIESISGDTIRFTTPFHMDFETKFKARISRMGDANNVIPAVKNSGVEDLYVAFGEGGDGGGNITIYGAAYCWVKNIESEKSNGSNINIFGSFRCVLRDSYIHTTLNPNPGGGGYGISINVYSADNLIENNISWDFNKVMVMRASGGGNVIAYNYMDDGWGATYPTQPELGLNACHYAMAHHELFEGNESFNFASESYWGNSAYITVFRNHMTSIRSGIGKENYTHVLNPGQQFECVLHYEDIQERRAVGIKSGSYFYTFIGNVLGTDKLSIIPKQSGGCVGQPTAGFTYEITAPNGSGDENYVPMWRIDTHMDQLTGKQEDHNVSDKKVIQTLIRDGNFDYVTNKQHWDRTEQIIPNSLYLTEKPAFFGNQPWPWVTPEKKTPLSGMLPAKMRFFNIPDTSSNPTDTSVASIFNLANKDVAFICSPNPFSDEIYITVSNTHKNGTIYIYDYSGNLISDLTKQLQNTTKLKWNGTDENGVKKSNGIYFVRFVDDTGKTQIQKIILNR